MKNKAHPWHGIHPGKDAPELIRCFIEVVPGDEMKYEIDKTSGYLIVDRPNTYSNMMPALYGFIPQTYSAKISARFCMEQTGLTGITGDGDPLDVCVLTDRHILRGDVLVEAYPIGGFRMIDHDETDDKIVAVLKGDHTYGHYKNIEELPRPLLKRLKHYFLTYKDDPDLNQESLVQIHSEYGREEALQVIKASFEDYGNLKLKDLF